MAHTTIAECVTDVMETFSHVKGDTNTEKKTKNKARQN